MPRLNPHQPSLPGPQQDGLSAFAHNNEKGDQLVFTKDPQPNDIANTGFTLQVEQQVDHRGDRMLVNRHQNVSPDRKLDPPNLDDLATASDPG